MLKLKFKTIAIAAIIASLLLAGFVVKSDAASVTSFSVYYGDDWGAGTTVSVSLTTDEDIYFIDWYIDDEYSFTSTHGDTQSVYEYLGTFVGDIKGIKYDIRAVVSFVESSDADVSDTIRVYKPIVRSNIGPLTGVSGSAYIYSQYFTGSAFGMTGSTYAYNGTSHTLNALGWFRLQEWSSEDGDFIDENRDTKDPDTDFEPGESYSVSPDSMEVEFPQNQPLRDDEARYFNAHTHLQVYGEIEGKTRVDDWEADTEQQTGTTAVKFTLDDI